MAKLDVILRTHSTTNVHAGERYVKASKEEVMLRCANSLVRSMNEVQADIALTVVDDRSTPDALLRLEAIIAKSAHPASLVHCNATVQNDSTLAHFREGLRRGRDLVYLVEDDYLHTPSAIREMLGAHALFGARRSGHEVALFPMDYPDRYLGELPEPTRILFGPERHWRTVVHSTNTCWLSIALLKRRWDLFEALARGYRVVPGVTEDNTINRIWRQDATLFSPIPSLALHLQFEEQKDPYLDWEKWWRDADYR